MKERPIIFDAESVRAILEGRKTQTRRVMKPQPILGKPWHGWVVDPDKMDIPIAFCPYGIRQDRLWVRETFQLWADASGKIVPHYKADYPNGLPFDMNWRSPIYMPRWASRITLEVTVERAYKLQDISGQDAVLEGWPGGEFAQLTVLKIKPPTASGNAAIEWYIERWDTLNAKRGFPWESSPWVWVVEFKLVRQSS